MFSTFALRENCKFKYKTELRSGMEYLTLQLYWKFWSKPKLKWTHWLKQLKSNDKVNTHSETKFNDNTLWANNNWNLSLKSSIKKKFSFQLLLKKIMKRDKNLFPFYEQSAALLTLCNFSKTLDCDSEGRFEGVLNWRDFFLKIKHQAFPSAEAFNVKWHTSAFKWIISIVTKATGDLRHQL